MLWLGFLWYLGEVRQRGINFLVQESDTPITSLPHFFFIKDIETVDLCGVVVLLGSLKNTRFIICTREEDISMVTQSSRDIIFILRPLRMRRRFIPLTMQNFRIVLFLR